MTPITPLLKKEAYSWTQGATRDFEKIKEAMCTNHVLSIPNLKKTFIIECDSLEHGIGAILMQKGSTFPLKESN